MHGKTTVVAAVVAGLLALMVAALAFAAIYTGKPVSTLLGFQRDGECCQDCCPQEVNDGK